MEISHHGYQLIFLALITVQCLFLGFVWHKTKDMLLMLAVAGLIAMTITIFGWRLG